MSPAVWSWRVLPRTIRWLGRCVTVVQLAGYTVALAFVVHTTRLTPGGIAARYRGADTAEGAMQFPKPLAEMLTLTHTHLLGMAALFAWSGLAVALCERVSERWKLLLIIEPFAALLLSFTAMWLMRYLHPGFAALLAFSSGLMAVTFYLQSLLVLRELGWRDPP